MLSYFLNVRTCAANQWGYKDADFLPNLGRHLNVQTSSKINSDDFSILTAEPQAFLSLGLSPSCTIST